MALILIGAPYPEISLVFGGLGMVVTAVLGLWQVSLSLVVAFIIIGAIHLYRGKA